MKVISVENLSKSYYLGQIGTGTFTNDLKVWWARVRGAPNPLAKIGDVGRENGAGEIWALKDISFEVEQGEVLGIIGKNGAGKSTLLKILSRVTAPTSGVVRVKGRIASLLEVGTGFHPELTGRENIYLNGAILGMSRAEIDRKFDEIVDFSGVEQFIDTPVKRYSSGMYVRLAFAVAAHLEPEILVVDEVLAVGDAEFQKKCLGKMGAVANEGRTVLFVSHNMAAIIQLCKTGLLIEKGILRCEGQAELVVRKYLSSSGATDNFIELDKYHLRSGTGEIRFKWVSLQANNGEGSKRFSLGDDINIVFRITAEEGFTNKPIKLAIAIRNSLGINIANMVDEDSSFRLGELNGAQTIVVSITDVRLYPDKYYISVWAGSTKSTETFDLVIDCLKFEIVSGGRLATRPLPKSAGLIFLTPEWKLIETEND